MGKTRRAPPRDDDRPGQLIASHVPVQLTPLVKRPRSESPAALVQAYPPAPPVPEPPPADLEFQRLEIMRARLTTLDPFGEDYSRALGDLLSAESDYHAKHWPEWRRPGDRPLARGMPFGRVAP